MLNLIVVGNSGVGKTSLINRFVNGTFDTLNSPMSTMGMTFSSKEFVLGEDTISLQIWDTAGSDIYLKQITQTYINTFWKNIAGVIVVAENSNVTSLEVAEQWIDLINKYVHTVDGDSVPFILAINKCDDDFIEGNLDTVARIQPAED